MRRLFSTAFRRARRAEGRGDYREAAAFYAEADAPEEAAKALLFHAARARTLDERLAAYRDALRWLPEGHPRRDDVESRVGLAILDEAQRRGAHGADDRRRLEEAAETLERVDRPLEAATAWELLGRREDLARCLQKAGEVERLEALLDEGTEAARRERRLRHLVSDYEMSMAVGARVEARDALREATKLAPDDRSLADLARRLEARWLTGRRVVLRVDGRDVHFIGRASAVLGRDADVIVRGTSVSRRHTELERTPEGVRIRDLGSRNGTLVRGLPIAGELLADGETTIGLGDDVEVRVIPEGAGMRLVVERGLDRDLVALLGVGTLPVPGLDATVAFPDGNATLYPPAGRALHLGEQRVAAPIVLLREDRITFEGHAMEVV